MPNQVDLLHFLINTDILPFLCTCDGISRLDFACMAMNRERIGAVFLLHLVVHDLGHCGTCLAINLTISVRNILAAPCREIWIAIKLCMDSDMILN